MRKRACLFCARLDTTAVQRHRCRKKNGCGHPDDLRKPGKPRNKINLARAAIYKRAYEKKKAAAKYREYVVSAPTEL